ncbi:Hint domain-containing protein [Acetobacter cibinongensis]|uniref:Hedgehog/Intein (Hint) domain-containing protein n=1 Tax=Acetobacter cibinongensis TaxID=146475 RepID=A0A1Z5YWA2_9PROT|nr:hypothetical protein HK14_02415 [Acetobacter cibinongensis]
MSFLASTLIQTAHGDVAVEDIRLGDSLMTWDWKIQSKRVSSVTWAGRKHMRANTALPDAEAGYPVRILKDALADGVPYKDLLVTPDHHLFFEDRFIPVRMLVNGRSIFYDYSLVAYDYFHVEAEKHSVIWSDGALNESYLDTGDRNSFRQEGKVVRLGQPSKDTSWNADATADRGVALRAADGFSIV